METLEEAPPKKGTADIKTCTIKVLPQELWASAAEMAVKINPANAPAISQLMAALPNAVIPPEHLALLTAKYWGVGGVNLTVGFLDNPPADLRARLLSHMNAWGAFGKVTFTETATNPQVRISRTAGSGYWSYLGTDILSIPAGQPTMNLDSFSMSTPDSEFYRVVRHETGHTLGFPHEHLRTEIVNGIDTEKAIAYFMATQGWSRDQVIAQVLTPIPQSALIATAQADPNSIMCYWLPASIMKNGVAIPGGTDIDTLDGQFAGQVYPRLVNLHARSTTLISVVARYPAHLDVFAVASDGRTMSNWWDQNGGWAPWFQLAGGVASGGGAGSPITSVARVPGHLDLFTVGTDNRVYSMYWDQSSGWSNWFQIGNITCRPGSTVNVVCRYSDHLDLFTTGANGETMSTWWDANGGWANWFQISGGVAANGATVTAISRFTNHLDVFTIGTDNKVYSCWWDANGGWSNWFAVGNQVCHPNSSVNVVSRFTDHLDLFTTASNGAIMSTWWDANGGWGSWFQVSGGVASQGSQVTAVSRNPNHLDVFVTGTDNRIYSTWWDANGGWAGWFNVSGGVTMTGGQVTAISRNPNHLDLFTVGTDGVVYSTWWDANGGWAGWFQLL
jgi:hypothetical protein